MNDFLSVRAVGFLASGRLSLASRIVATLGDFEGFTTDLDGVSLSL